MFTMDPASVLGRVSGRLSAGFSTGTAAVSAAELIIVACLLVDLGDSTVAVRLAGMVSISAESYATLSENTTKADGWSHDAGGRRYCVGTTSGQLSHRLGIML